MLWDKSPVIAPFSDEQARTLVNLEQHYSVWIDAARALDALPYNLQRKEVSGRSYLYEIRDRRGNGTGQLWGSRLGLASQRRHLAALSAGGRVNRQPRMGKLADERSVVVPAPLGALRFQR